jgi:AcrR family transcriptional regulator
MADSRTQRHEGTRRAILDAAWALARERGLTGWTLRDLGTATGMRAPSLYVYFAGKDEIYDAMFADGNRALLAATEEWRSLDLAPVEMLRAGAHMFFDFAVSDPARMQLLFQRVIPSFTPSAASYAIAEELVRAGASALAAAGVTDPAAIDIWTALLTGLASQQVSNDPGGHRWADLVDRAVDAFIAYEVPAAIAPVSTT